MNRNFVCSIATVFSFVLIISCGPQRVSRQGQENPLFDGSIGTPQGPVIPEPEKKDIFETVWKTPLTLRLNDLPEKGSVSDDEIPYSGFWYPNNSGGTGIRMSTNDSTALEKYDNVFNNGTSSAATWEKTNHGPNGADWAGHCNGWTAASQRHQEPSKAVTKNGVTFQPRDIKALLVEVHMSAIPAILGGERCKSASLSDTQCKPINPALFHITLANWIGLKGHSVSFDKSSTSQVWNYPLYAYSAQITSASENEGRRMFTSTAAQNASKFVSVTLTITHADSLDGSTGIESNTAPTRKSKNVIYTYMLALDSESTILDGAWTTRSDAEPPEFVWLAFEPIQNTEGNRFLGNPNLNLNNVFELWAESIGTDVNSAPKDLMSPCFPLKQCVKI